MNILRMAIFVSILLSGILSTQAHAARVWLFQNVEVDDVEVNIYSSTSAVRIKLADTSGVEAYSCAPTQQAGVVSYSSGSFTSFMQAILSAALSAQAQGAKVDILVETSSCNTSGNWPNLNSSVDGLGLEIRAIRISTE